MANPLLVLSSDAIRAKAIDWIKRLPDGTRVEFKRPRRTLPQNDRLHAMLTDVAEQVEYFGKKRTLETWKRIFAAAYTEAEILPSLDGKSLVQIGRPTSDMNKEELGGLMELISEYGARHGVVFHDKEEAA